MAINAQTKNPSGIDTPNLTWAVLFYDDNQKRWGFKKDDGSVKYFTEVGDETLTSLALNSNTLTYTDEAGNNTDIDLSIYLDDTNLARLVNGTLDPNTGIATFTRDDGTSFTVDFSSLIDIQTVTTLTESPTGVFTYTSEDSTTTVIDISSFETSTQLDARDTANRSRANHTGTQTASTISDFDTEVSNNSSVVANTAKVSNATHTGEVFGSTSLALDPSSISNKTEKATLVGTEQVLINDAGTLKKCDTQSIADLSSGSATQVVCPMHFGANFDSVGRFAVVNGRPNDADQPGNSNRVINLVIADGTLTKLAYNTENADNTTVIKIWKNGVVDTTLTLSPDSNNCGVETISISVSACDLISIEYDAGQEPDESTWYFLQELD